MMPHLCPAPSVPGTRLVFVGLLLAAVAGCSEPSVPPPTPSLAVETVVPRMRELDREVAASGAIAAWEETAVGVELSGLRVVEVAKEVGDQVRRGDVLLRLDSRTLRVQRIQADAGLAQAKANAQVAAQREQRTSDLAKSGYVSRQDAEQAQAEATSAQAQLAVAQASLQATQLQLGFSTVLAPVDGVVSARNVQPGEVVAAGTELIRLIRDERLEWRGELAEADLIRIVPGAKVLVAGPGNVSVDGTVRQVSPALDPLRRTGTVYVDLPQPEPLRAGMFAAGRIVLGRSEALVIPLEAIVRRDGREYVFVVNDESRVSERLVDTGVVSGSDIEVRSGLIATDRVVARGGGFLGDGDLVREVPPSAAVDAGVVPAAKAE